MAEGTLETWCVRIAEGRAELASAGARVELQTQRFEGTRTRCTPRADDGAPRTVSDVALRAIAAPPEPRAPAPMPPRTTDDPRTEPAVPAQPAGVVPETTTPPPALAAPALAVEIGRNSSWVTGYCARATVQNPTPETGTWRVQQLMFGTLTSSWNCEVERTRLGATFTGQPWNGTLEPGAMAEFGYCVEYAL